jgi:hypothetical protein
MSQNYLRIQQEYLQKAWSRPFLELELGLPALRQEGCFHFQAFGEACVFCPESILLGGDQTTGPEGLLIAMYASHAVDEPVQPHPLQSFKELPGSMPYHAAFSANAERILMPHVTGIESLQEKIISSFSGHQNKDAVSGDFSFTLYPLPRILLYYIFHLPDEEFPASVTCLFAANALKFTPLDGLADVAEYTAKKSST